MHETEEIQTMTPTSEPAIKILLVEDHDLTRLGLAALLRRTSNLRVVAEASNGRDAVIKVESACPDVILMDIGLPVLDGIQATREILSVHSGARIIMLTQNDNFQAILAALDAGASGYCLKDVEPDQLYSAVRAVHSGAVWLDSALRHNSQINRTATQEQRVSLQKKREELFEKREILFGKEDSDWAVELELKLLESQIQELQQNILDLQTNNDGQQKVVNVIRRAASCEDEVKWLTEDTQTRKEKLQTLEENVQRLREDMQRQREQWKRRGQNTLS